MDMDGKAMDKDLKKELERNEAIAAKTEQKRWSALTADQKADELRLRIISLERYSQWVGCNDWINHE